jgi:hypothetical protein
MENLYLTRRLVITGRRRTMLLVGGSLYFFDFCP